MKRYWIIIKETIHDTFWDTMDAIWGFKWVRRIFWLIVSTITVFCIFYLAIIFNAFGMNTVQDGWRSGSLSNYTKSNRIAQWLPFGIELFPTGEGHLLLGNDSSRISVHGHMISPSLFSTSTAIFDEYSKLTSKMVAMHYRQINHRIVTGGETDIRANEFQKLTGEKIPANCSSTSHGWLTKQVGYIGGKVVEVAREGNPYLWKTYEVIIHAGGNEYKEMSITDEHVYQCAILALKSGEVMRIAYDNRIVRDPLAQNTTYNLIGIEE